MKTTISSSITLDAPAKVNLYLAILGKRQDGYHRLCTIFERIRLSDRITLKKSFSGISLSSDVPITNGVSENIAYKAAVLFFKKAAIEGGVSIFIKKNIPIAAGLGGGSSDAASVLRGLNMLYGKRISMHELLRMGAMLGADVPFFILNTDCAIGSGNGAVVKPIKMRNRPWHVVVYPGGGKRSTKDIYDDFDRGKSGLTMLRADDKIQRLKTKDVTFSGLRAMLYNDLEDIVRAKNGTISTIIERLAFSGGKRAILAGSGPSVFCLQRTRKEAEAVRRAFLRNTPISVARHWQVVVA